MNTPTAERPPWTSTRQRRAGRAVERVDNHWDVWHYVDLEFDTVVERPECLDPAQGRR